jgi:hypothetical protein
MSTNYILASLARRNFGAVASVKYGVERVRRGTKCDEVILTAACCSKRCIGRLEVAIIVLLGFSSNVKFSRRRRIVMPQVLVQNDGGGVVQDFCERHTHTP